MRRSVYGRRSKSLRPSWLRFPPDRVQRVGVQRYGVGVGGFVALGGAGPDPERAADAARYIMVLRCVNQRSLSALARLGSKVPLGPPLVRPRVWMRRCRGR